MATRPHLADIDLTNGKVIGTVFDAVIASDISKTSTTVLADILTFANVPVGTWQLDGLILLSSSSSNPDAQLAVKGPTGTTGRVLFMGYGAGASGLSASFPNEAPFSFTGSPPVAGPAVAGIAASIPGMATIMGRIVITTAGDVTIQGAQQASNATATVFSAGSYAFLRRVA